MQDEPQCSKPEYRDWFFVEPQYENGKLSQTQIQRQMRIHEIDAKLICDFCPVKALCAEYATLAKEEWGIWGGLTPADRRAIYASAKSNKPGLSKATRLFD